MQFITKIAIELIAATIASAHSSKQQPAGKRKKICYISDFLPHLFSVKWMPNQQMLLQQWLAHISSILNSGYKYKNAKYIVTAINQ